MFCLSQAIFKLIPKDEQDKLPADENTPEKRAEKLWSYFNKKDNGKVPLLSLQHYGSVIGSWPLAEEALEIWHFYNASILYQQPASTSTYMDV